MSNVLFVCLHNAGRSQMSAALFELAAGGRHHARSAGTEPAEQVNPVVVDAMRELGIDISDRTPQTLTTDLAQWADLVVTMGCGDTCPYIPGRRYIDWDSPIRQGGRSTKSAASETRSRPASTRSLPSSARSDAHPTPWREPRPPISPGAPAPRRHVNAPPLLRTRAEVPAGATRWSHGGRTSWPCRGRNVGARVEPPLANPPSARTSEHRSARAPRRDRERGRGVRGCAGRRCGDARRRVTPETGPDR